MQTGAGDVVFQYWGCVLHVEKCWVDGHRLKNPCTFCWPNAIFKEAFRECWPFCKVQGNVALYFMTCVDSALSWKEPLKVASNHKRSDPTCYTANPDCDSEWCEKRTAWYTLLKSFIMVYMKKQKLSKYGWYQSLLDTRVGSIVEAMDLKKPHTQILLIRSRSARFLITRGNCLP